MTETKWIVQSAVLCSLSGFFIIYFLVAIWEVRRQERISADKRDRLISPRPNPTAGGGGVAGSVLVKPAPSPTGTIGGGAHFAASPRNGPGASPLALAVDTAAATNGGAAAGTGSVTVHTLTILSPKAAASAAAVAVGNGLGTVRTASTTVPASAVTAPAAAPPKRTVGPAGGGGYAPGHSVFLSQCRSYGLVASALSIGVGLDVESSMGVMPLTGFWLCNLASQVVVMSLFVRWCCTTFRALHRQTNTVFPRTIELGLLSIPPVFGVLAGVCLLYYTLGSASAGSRIGYVVFRILQTITVDLYLIALMRMFFTLRTEINRFIVRSARTIDTSHLTSALTRLSIPVAIVSALFVFFTYSWLNQAIAIIVNHELYAGAFDPPTTIDIRVANAWGTWIYLSVIAWFGSPWKTLSPLGPSATAVASTAVGGGGEAGNVTVLSGGGGGGAVSNKRHPSNHLRVAVPQTHHTASAVGTAVSPVAATPDGPLQPHAQPLTTSVTTNTRSEAAPAVPPPQTIGAIETDAVPPPPTVGGFFASPLTTSATATGTTSGS